MHETLLGYLLAALEPDEHADVQQILRTCDKTRGQVEMLKRGLEPLEGDDHEELQIPWELAVRTCQLVRAARMPGELRLE